MSQKRKATLHFLKFEKETYRIIGAALEVARNLGHGFLESVYQEAMVIELCKQNIPFIAQDQIEIQYKGIKLKKTFIADFSCYGKIIVELKAIQTISSREEAQLLNYLKATNFEIGLILNFGSRKLTWKRLINSQ